MSQQFQYSRDGGVTWDWSTPDGVIPDAAGSLQIRWFGKASPTPASQPPPAPDATLVIIVRDGKTVAIGERGKTLAMWDRELTPDEREALKINPFQIFEQPSPARSDKGAERDPFLAYWTSIETDTRKALILGARTDTEKLHELLRTVYEAASTTSEGKTPAGEAQERTIKVEPGNAFIAPPGYKVEHMAERTPSDLAGALEEFTAYMVRNYPADTIIGDPTWHAPQLFNAALYFARSAAAGTTAAPSSDDARDAARYRLLRDSEKVPGQVWAALESGEGVDEAMDLFATIVTPIAMCEPCKAGRYAECEYVLPCTLPADTKEGERK